jgi:hypothetical protein
MEAYFSIPSCTDFLNVTRRGLLVLLGDTIDEADCKTWTDNGGGLIFGF